MLRSNDQNMLLSKKSKARTVPFNLRDQILLIPLHTHTFGYNKKQNTGGRKHPKQYPKTTSYIHEKEGEKWE